MAGGERVPLKLVLYADGASRGNPGPAAIGALVKDENGKTLAQVSGCLGVATNNQAEYEALIAGLIAAREAGGDSIEVNLDSELVVKHINGDYSVRDAHLRVLFNRVRQLLGAFAEVKVKHIGRDLNSEAHTLSAAAFSGSQPCSADPRTIGSEK